MNKFILLPTLLLAGCLPTQNHEKGLESVHSYSIPIFNDSTSFSKIKNTGAIIDK
ncbi:MAG: hypothetical protein JNL53_20110, partial [Cyclobacteriaceae bacterium]|nr:hypothetical protein [Cyclobacteriaceae bacterium]